MLISDRNSEPIGKLGYTGLIRTGHMTSRLKLLEAGSSDLADITRFIEKIGSPYIILPPDRKIKESVIRGLSFKLINERGQIMGFTSATSTSRNDSIELANSVTDRVLRKGFGFQHQFTLVRAAAVVIDSYASRRLVTAIKPGNFRSITNMCGAGFECNPDFEWECEGCKFELEAYKQNRKCCCDSYVLSLQAHRNLCREFVDRLRSEGPVVRLSNGSEETELELDCAVALGQAQQMTVDAFATGLSADQIATR